MLISDNYRDFIVRLVDMVTKEKVDTELFRFTVIQAYTIAMGVDDEIWDRIRPLCADDNIMKPWSFISNTEITTEERREGFQQAMEMSISSCPKGWLLLQVYYIGAWASIDWADYTRCMEKAKQLLQEHPEFRCFRPRYYHIDAWVRSREADMEGLHDIIQNGLNIARECNDTYYISGFLVYEAGLYQSSDPHKALEILEESFSLSETLGDIVSVEDTASLMGWIYQTLGEYDLALKFLLWGFDQGVRAIRPDSIRGGAVAWKMSVLYNDLNMPEQAMEWIKWYDGGGEGEPHQFVYLQKALTLHHLRQFDEGQKYLNKAYDLVIQSGYDTQLVQYQHINGVCELLRGELHAALHTLSEALAEYERQSMSVYALPGITRCLLSLTEAEMKIASKSRERNPETSGQWMDRLGTHARERNYLGIRMQHALLKAEYQAICGNREAALLTLKDALTFSDSIGVKTLRERIVKQIDKLQEVTV